MHEARWATLQGMSVVWESYCMFHVRSHGETNHVAINSTPSSSTASVQSRPFFSRMLSVFFSCSASRSVQDSVVMSLPNMRNSVNTEHLASVLVIAVEPQEDSIEGRLLAWQNSGLDDGEQQLRGRAANKIRACINNGDESLSLSWLGLTSLPKDVFQHISSLRTLDLGYNKLENLDLHSCTGLTTLYCMRNDLISINLSGCTGLNSLECPHNHLTSLNLSGCTGLTYLDCTFNQLTALDLNHSTELTSIDCFSNELTALNLSHCTELTELSCGANQLIDLDIHACKRLTGLSCSANQLTSLDIHGYTELTKVSCSRNQLTSLDLHGCVELTKISCDSNQLINLNVDGCTSLTNLDCSGNQLTSLDIAGCTSLKELSCTENQLANLDVGDGATLESLSCSNNQLTALDLSYCHSLRSLYVQDNSLLRNLTFPQRNLLRQNQLMILLLHNTAVRWNHIPQLIRESRHAHIDIRPIVVNHNINQAQNTHTASIHRSVSNSATKLKNNNPDINIDQAYEDLSAWVSELPIENSAIENGYANEDFKNKTAKEWIQNPSHLNYIDLTSQVSVKGFLALAWVAIHDGAQKESGTPLQNAKESLRDALYEIKRGYNFNDAQNPIDNGEESRNICAGGTFNKISEKLVSVVKDISSHFITQETFVMSLHASIRQEVTALIQNDIEAEQRLNDYAIGGGDVDLTDIDLTLTEDVWSKIKDSIKSTIDEKFQSVEKISGKTINELFNEHADFDNVLEYLSVTPTEHAYTTHLRASIRQEVAALITADKEVDKSLNDNQGLLTQFVWDKIKDNVETVMSKEFQSKDQIGRKSTEQLFNEHSQFEQKLSSLNVMLSRLYL